jgi:hypothetical protein
MTDTKVTHARIELVIDLLTAASPSQPIRERAADIVDKLDALTNAVLEPPGEPPVIEAYGDAKSRKVVSALMDNPEVLYGVLGILHNIKVAGPWEHKPTGQREKQSSKNGLKSIETVPTMEFWFRRDARMGGDVARITPLDAKRGNTQCKWEIQGRLEDQNEMTGNAAELAEAMAAVDVYLGTQQGWLLVPGWKEA